MNISISCRATHLVPDTSILQLSYQHLGVTSTSLVLLLSLAQRMVNVGCCQLCIVRQLQKFDQRRGGNAGSASPSSFFCQVVAERFTLAGLHIVVSNRAAMTPVHLGCVKRQIRPQNIDARRVGSLTLVDGKPLVWIPELEFVVVFAFSVGIMVSITAHNTTYSSAYGCPAWKISDNLQCFVLWERVTSFQPCCLAASTKFERIRSNIVTLREYEIDVYICKVEVTMGVYITKR